MGDEECCNFRTKLYYKIYVVSNNKEGEILGTLEGNMIACTAL